MGDLVPRRAAEVGDKGAGPRPRTTPGQTLGEGSFSSPALSFVEVFSLAPSGSGPVVAQMVRQLTGVRRAGQTYYRRRSGWSAYRDVIVLGRTDQPLVPRPDGRFAPVGTWSVPTYEVLTAGRVSRRVGDVPADGSSGGEGAAAGGAGAPQAAGMTTWGREEEDAAFLPAAVRSGLVDALPSPTYAIAQAIAHSDAAGGVTHHTVRALRHDDRQAVALIASRQAEAAQWQVEQVVYDLTAPPGAREVDGPGEARLGQASPRQVRG